MGGTSADYGAVQQTGQNRRPRLTAAPAEKGGGGVDEDTSPFHVCRNRQNTKHRAHGEGSVPAVRFRAAIPEILKRSPVMARAGPFPGARRRSRRPDGRTGDTFFYRAKSSPRLPLFRETHVRKRHRTAVRTKRGCPTTFGQPLFRSSREKGNAPSAAFRIPSCRTFPQLAERGGAPFRGEARRRCGERRLRTATCRCRSSQEYRR